MLTLLFGGISASLDELFLQELTSAIEYIKAVNLLSIS